MYKIVFTSRFERTFKKLDKKTQRLLLEAIEQLAQDPFNQPHIRKIIGIKQNGFRLRVGRWRILYILLTKEEVLEVIDLFMRKEQGDYRRM
ncbi:type II toxin-antitoxin system RelE/ParE family toxin [Candidatus Uhrbacteria bacterium]|nr:type II toxin-antitoxin system RelE/ParE family toxin [Candidatus Uhrbacteria bacterium]